MLSVNRKLITAGAEGELAAEASSLGLKPGEWPEFIAVLDDHGDGFLFMRVRAERANGELVGMHYDTRTGGARLTVWND